MHWVGGRQEHESEEGDHRRGMLSLHKGKAIQFCVYSSRI